MEYIDAEQLSEKIESISLYTQKSADYNDGRDDMKMMVLDLLDSLQQEQPEVDLEKELIQWHKRHFKKTGTYEKYSGFYLENSSQLDLARHFYELGLNARK